MTDNPKPKIVMSPERADDVSLLNYFACHEPTSPPQSFMMAEFPPNKVRGANGEPAPQLPPEAPALAAALAKWRFMVAEKMVEESAKRE